jgi:cytochrome d ubiquinol oxidase subunit II
MLYNAIPFALVFVAFTGWLLMKEGYAYNPANGEVTMEPHKYLHNLVEMPLVGFLFVAGVASVLFGIYVTVFREKNANGIWYTAPGTVLTVFSLFLIAGFNNTAYYPSSYDLQSSLTIQNSSSSQYTLTIMSYVSLLVPFVGAYITYAWRAINKKKIDKDEIQGDGHKY